MLSDMLRMEELLINCAQTKPKNHFALSSIASALCRVVPLIAALRGKPLFLNGTVSKRVDLTQKEVTKLLKSAKSAKPIIDLAGLIDAGEPDEPADVAKKSKESLSNGQG